MAADPAVRADGRCAGPGCRKQRRLPKSTRYAGRHVHERDPFCSRLCCERFHGIDGRHAADADEPEQLERVAS